MPQRTASAALPLTSRSLDDLTDAVLVDRARDGDARAFEVLVRRHQRRMYALATRITGSYADGEDVVSMAFTTAWRSLPTFRGDAALSTWLYRIVTNTALAVVRARRPEGTVDERFPAREPGHRGPEATALRTALAEALAQALADVPPTLRVAWLLREVEGFSYDEIATIVEVPVSTVRGRIARARADLAVALAGWR